MFPLILIILAQVSAAQGFSHEHNLILEGEKIMPRKGVFLVANQRLSDPRFRRTVILLLTHEEGGTVGVIVNRPTKIPVSEVFPNFSNKDIEASVLFFGGPVGIDSLIFLVRSNRSLPGVTHVMEDVYFGGDAEVLQKFIKGSTSVSKLRLYIGYSGWAPGQLDSEIKNGGWNLGSADSYTVFDKDFEKIWPHLIGPAVDHKLNIRYEWNLDFLNWKFSSFQTK